MSSEELSERLQGIADSLTVHAATLFAENARARMTPEVMDELRHWIGVAVRGAALEGARNATETKAALLPVPKTGRAQAQLMAVTHVRDTPVDNKPLQRHKLPGGV